MTILVSENYSNKFIGSVFNRLVVIKYHGRDAFNKPTYQCRCVCGKTVIRRLSTLKTSPSASCGCFMKELKTEHGLSYHPLYNIHRNMIVRCGNYLT